MRGVRGFGDPHPAMLPQRQVGVAPADGHLSRRCCRSGPTSTTSAWPSSQDLAHGWRQPARRVQRRALRPMGAGQGHAGDDGPPAGARTSPSTTPSPTPSRCATPTTARSRPHRPQPLLHVDRLGRQRRQGRRPGAQQRRGPATAGRPTPSGSRRPGSPGRSTRTPAPGSTGRTTGAGHPRRPTSATTATTRCCTSTQYQNATPGSPLLRQGPHRHRRADARAGASSTSCRTTCRAARCRRSRGSCAPEAFTEHPNWPAELRRLVHLPGPRRAHQQPGRLGEDRAVPDVRRERRLLRPRGPAVPQRRRADRRTRRCRSTNELYTGQGRRPRTVRPRHPGPDDGRSPPGAPAAGSARRPSTTPRSSGSWSALRGARAATSPRGAERSAATSPRPSTSPARQPGADPAAPRRPSRPTGPPPDPPGVRPSGQQHVPRQEPGTRPARPLDYHLKVDLRSARQGLASPSPTTVSGELTCRPVRRT